MCIRDRGDPTEGSDSYFRTFADTPKSIVRAAALLHDIPVIIDELQSKGAPGGQASKRQIVEDLLYSLSLGHERGALNSDRSMMRDVYKRQISCDDIFISDTDINVKEKTAEEGLSLFELCRML